MCAALLLSVPAGEAKLFDSPEAVNYLHAEVMKEGSITLESAGPGAIATRLEIRHSVPQGTYRQTTELLSVTGPDDYSFDEDEFGNEIMVLTWDDPPLDQRLDYSIVFDVKVWDRDDPAAGTDFPVTAMTEASQEITEKAYELTGGLTTREKFMELTSYVFDIVDYDRSYQNVQKSAQWVFENRKAVCDGHANLLISMLRALGYNAYYVIGYAYTEENLDPDNPNYWGPHGWVEVEHDGKAVSLDPTWLQHPVDATHIKFAIAPDSNYTEYVETMANRIMVNWEKGDYLVRMLDSTEEPRIGAESRLVPARAGSGEHALMITDVRSSMDSPCVLTRLMLASCRDGGRPFLKLEPDEAMLGFCGNTTLYWILGVPGLSRGVEYSCGVNLYGAGISETGTLVAAGEPDFIDARISTRKVLTAGQLFQVNTTVENSGLSESDLELFMMLDDRVQETSISLDALQAADLVWTMRAPRQPGEYIMRFFSSSGKLLEEDIQVVEKRSVRIANAAIPGNISLEGILNLNVTLLGLDDAMGVMRVSIGREEFEREFFIDKDEEKTFTFVYTPDTEGLKRVSIVVLSGEEDYEAALVGSLVVVREEEWWEPLWNLVGGLLEGLFSILGMNG